LLARTSKGREQKLKDLREKQLDFTQRCTRSEMSRSTYVSGQREFQPKEELVVGERKYRSCEGSQASEDMNFVHTIKVLSV
jgi:hypothetical protein